MSTATSRDAQTPAQGEPKISVVVPCYNEFAGLPTLIQRTSEATRAVFGDSFEIVLIDDGSSDGTWPLMQQHASHSPNVVAIKLARNHGHQLALTAGLEFARGELVFVIDADLQDDENRIRDMLACYRDGYDVVYGVRAARVRDSWVKRNFALAFYRVSALVGARVVHNHADFRFMSRAAVDRLREFRESNLFLRGLVPLVGLPSTTVKYDRRARHAGVTKYGPVKLFGLAWEAITSLSVMPLRLVSTIGLVFASDDEFRDTMIRLVTEAREYHAAPPGEYAIWRSRTGAEIWFHIEGTDAVGVNERAIAGLTPFYEGGRSTQLVITDVVRRTGYNPFEGAFQAKFGGTGDDAGIPLVFDAVNFAAYADRKLPVRLKVKLSGFAREVKAYPTEAEYYAAQTREPAFASRSFVPIGMFSPDPGDSADKQPPSSYAALTGSILEARRLENEATGRGFQWLLVDTVGGVIDIVADPDVVSGDVVEGATVEVICFMFGRIMD